MMQKPRLIPFFFFLYISSLSAVSASPFPDEYSDFFEKTEEDVVVIVQGFARSVSVKASVNFESFQLLDQSQAAITNYLQNQNLTEAAISGIVAQLQEGVAANPNCSGELINCIPEDIPNQAEFIFDYDTQVLRIFIATDMLTDDSKKQEYYVAVQDDVSLINHSNLYLYASNHNQNINWRNDTLIALPYGYLDIDTTYKFNDNGHDFQLEKALYNYEYNKLRFLVGYQNNAYTSLNSTDFLISGADTSGYSGSIGSSYNLLKGKKQAMQRLIFYVPQSGRLEVYRNERLVLARNIGSGEQSIGYDELPSGTYTINLMVKQSDDNVLFENQYLIVNHAHFSLPVGSWDYRFDLGQFENANYQSDSEEQYYFRSLLAYRATERILAAAGVSTNAEDMQLMFGSKLSLPYDIDLSYNLSLFSSGDFYHSGQLSIEPFNFGIRSLKHDNLQKLNPFVQALYGSKNINELSASVYADLLLGRTSLSYSYYDSESIDNAYTASSVSLSWYHTLFGGSFSANLSANMSKNAEDDFTISFNWARDFSQNGYFRVGVDFDDEGYLQTVSNYTHNYTEENWRASAQVDVAHHQKAGLSASTSASVSGANDHIDYDVYAFANTKDSYSVSTNLSNTQMLSAKGGAVTSKKGDAFVEFDPEWQGASANDDSLQDDMQEVNYSVTSSGKSIPAIRVVRGKSTISSVATYKEVNYALDKDFSGVDAQNDSGAFFSNPGTYRKVKSKIVPLFSQLFVFSDKDGNTIDKVECIGKGCRKVEELADDAIFRVSFLQNHEFELVSNGLVCEYDAKDLGKKFISSICVPRAEAGQFKSKATTTTTTATASPLRPSTSTKPTLTKPAPTYDTKRMVNMLLIGRYDKDKANEVLASLHKAGFVARSAKSVDGFNVYIKHQPSFSGRQVELLQGINDSITLNKLNPNLIFLMREQ